MCDGTFGTRTSVFFAIKPAHALPLTILQTTIKKHVMKAALKKGVEDGTLVQVKASYKLSAEAKKPAKKAAAKPKKAAAAKKKTTTATKKKVRACVCVCFACSSLYLTSSGLLSRSTHNAQTATKKKVRRLTMISCACCSLLPLVLTRPLLILTDHHQEDQASWRKEDNYQEEEDLHQEAKGGEEGSSTQEEGHQEKGIYQEAKGRQEEIDQFIVLRWEWARSIFCVFIFLVQPGSSGVYDIKA